MAFIVRGVVLLLINTTLFWLLWPAFQPPRPPGWTGGQILVLMMLFGPLLLIGSTEITRGVRQILAVRRADRTR